MNAMQREKLRQIDRDIRSAEYWIEAERRRLEELRTLRARFVTACESDCCGQCKGGDER